MGIPSFYRWVLDRYPRTVADAVEEAAGDGGDPIDTSRPNPNGMEYDNLYLDMNGIIHPCFHPEGLPAPKTYDEVFQAVFKYIDKIFSIVRPRKLLFLAIDGVAPRAKMNQQRSRRFKAAKDAADEVARIETPGNVYELKEEKSISLEQPSKLDSNVITPGTEFMSLLSSALRYFIHLRMNGDLGWRGLKVILSDANVPGEGEHKIMSYIRLQRNLPGFDPNTRHCLYGLDADLIMLALATHEIHFSILREDLQHKSLKNKSSKSARYSSLMGEVRMPSKKMEVFSVNLEDYISKLRFQFLNIWVLRDYLALDMKLSDLKVEEDLERLVDDFVFMCLFVGNDFLPHIPSLEISEGAIDLLMMIYKTEFARMGGYLTSSFEVNLERVQLFVQALGSHECAIFRKRNQIQKQREQHFRHSSNKKIVSQSSKKLRKAQVGQDPTNIQKQGEQHFQHPSNNKIVSQSSKKLRKAQVGQDPTNPSVMEIQASNNSAFSGMNTVVDKIKLGEEGWKERYYVEKFEAKTEEERERTRKHLVLKYVEGVCWVMHYYYEGVCSWQWFYPYHYAPFASDFYDIDVLKIQFTLGQPFKPFDQLMAVLPAASARALPLSYRKLMTDKLSPLLDLYPTEFELDMNGKRFSWQAICKLPFIEESRLLSEIAIVEHTLTDEERQRNNLGVDVLFFHISNPLAVNIVSFFRNNTGLQEFPKAEAMQKIDPHISGGMNGFMIISDKPVQPMQIYSPIEGMEIIANNEVLSILYKYPPSHPHIPRVPEGVNLPAKSIGKKDVLPRPVLWHQKTAVVRRIHSERPQILNSIYGPRLAKLAYELLSKFYLAKWQSTVDCMKHIGHVSVNGTSFTDSQTVCVEGTGRTRKRKQKQKHGSSDAINLPDNQVGVNGPIANMKLGEKLAVCESGGDKSCSNERSSEQGSGIPNKNLGAEAVVVESRKRRQKRKRSKGNDIPYNHVVEDGQKQTQGSDIPDENEGADGLACHSNLVGRVFDGRGDEKFVVVDSQKQKHRKGNDVADNHVEGDGLACSNLREAITPVGAEHSGNCIDGNEILDNHVAEDGQTKGSGIPDDHVGVDGVACNTELEERICLAGAEGEKVVVESQKSKRKRKRRKGNGIPENLVSGDGLDGNKILVYNVAEDGQKQTEGSGIPADRVGVDGLACNTDLEERIRLAGTEGEKLVVESQKPKRKRKRKKGNGIPENVVGGDGVDGNRILEDHVAEDGRKQTEGNGIPADLVAADGLACNTDFESLAGTEDGNKILEYNVAEDGQKQTEGSGIPADHVGVDGLACNTDLGERIRLAGTEGEKLVVESQKPKRKRKRKKGNGIPENVVGGDGVDGNRILEDHVAEDGQKQTEGSGIPADLVAADGLACNTDFESLAGTEVGNKILEYNVAEDGQKQTEGSGIPADHVGVDGLACNTDLEERIRLAGTEGEKLVVESQKPKRKRKRKKGNGIPENVVGGDGVDGNRILEDHVAEDGQKQTEGSGIPADLVAADGLACNTDFESLAGTEDGNKILEYNVAEDGQKQTEGSGIPADHVGVDGLACNTDLEERICLAGTEGEKLVVESRTPKRKRKRKKGNGIPENVVGGDGVDGNRILEDHVAEDGQKQTEGSGIPADLVAADGLACNTDFESLAGTEVGNKILEYNVAEDGQKQTEGSGIPADHVGVDGLACNTDLEERIRLAGTEGEKLVVESQKPKRKRKHKKGNGIPENVVGGDGVDGNRILEDHVAEDGQKQTEGSGIPADLVAADGLACNTDFESLAGTEDGNKILEYNVAEDGQKQTEGSGIPADHVGVDGLVCNTDLEERICLAGTEGEKLVVESRTPKRKRKRKKGNGIPENVVGGDGVDGNRILEDHVVEDGQKQTEGSGIPADLVAADGLACNTDFESLAGTEGEKVEVESQKPIRKQKHRKRKGIPENLVGGDVVDGNRILEYHAAEDGRKQTEGSCIPADHVGADGLACNTDFESLAGTEGEKIEVESQKPIRKQKHREGKGIPENLVGRDVVDGNRILEHHVAEDGGKQTEGSCIPADLVAADGLACNTDFVSLAGTEGEKVEVESQKPIRKRKRRKGKGIPENLVGGDVVDGNRILENHVAEDGRKQTEGCGIPADHLGVDGLACNTDLVERICLAGTEGEKVIIESQKPKRKRKHRIGNGIPENLVGGDGLACSNTRVAIGVVGTESNRNFIDGNRILDNHVAEDDLKQTKSSIPDDHEGEDGLTCHSSLVGKFSVGAGGEKSVVVEFQEQNGPKGNAIADNHVQGDGLACSNLKEAITPVGTGNNGNCIDGNKFLGNHVAEVGQKQNGNGIPDEHVDAHELASRS